MGVDFGFCELPTAIDVPIVPPLMGCEVDAVAVGMPVTLVGFGRDEENVRGIKRAVTTTLNDIDNSPMQPTLEYWIGDLTAGGCRGDSGGPAFVEMVDGTWRVLGVASWAALLGYACGFGSSYGKLHEAVAWIEATSGFDITGCHDAGGAWNPGPQCQGFPLEPQAGTASWPRGCASSLQDMAQTCAVPDVAAPEVAIVEPIDGATFELLSDTTVAIAFEGTIYDASGRLETAELRIDGTVAATSAHPPFRWPLRMPPGSHEIELFARDRSGNENAAKVAIEVTEDGAGSSRGSSEGSSETIAGSDATSTGGNPSQGSHGSVAPLPQQGEDGCACRSEPAIMPFAWIWLGVLGLRRRTDRRLNLRDHTPKSPPISRHK
jgi:MYXO-CTERM domain-containing protein